MGNEQKESRLLTSIQQAENDPGNTPDATPDGDADTLLNEYVSKLTAAGGALAEAEHREYKTCFALGDIEVPEGITCCVYAQGGIGKSGVLRSELWRQGVDTIYISAEESRERVRGIMGVYFPDGNATEYTEPYSPENSPFYLNCREPMGRLIDALPKLIEGCIQEPGSGAQVKAQVVVIDPLSAFLHGKLAGIELNRAEVDNGVAGVMMAKLNEIATKHNCTIVFTHHVNKASGASGDIRTAARGSSALLDNARMGIVMYDYGSYYEAKKSKEGYASALRKTDNHTAHCHAACEEITEEVSNKGLIKNADKDGGCERVHGVIVAEAVKNNYGGTGYMGYFLKITHRVRGLVSQSDGLDFRLVPRGYKGLTRSDINKIYYDCFKEGKTPGWVDKQAEIEPPPRPDDTEGESPNDSQLTMGVEEIIY